MIEWATFGSIDDFVIGVIDPSFYVGNIFCSLSINLVLIGLDESWILLAHLSHPLFVLAGHVSDPVVSDALQVISSLAGVLLSKLGSFHILLPLEIFERLGFVLEPGVDNIRVEAIAHQVLCGLFHILLECVSDGMRLLLFSLAFSNFFGFVLPTIMIRLRHVSPIYADSLIVVVV